MKYHDESNIVKIPRSKKPRVKDLNEALMTRPAGKMKNPKDHSRMKQKRELAHLIQDNDD